jgi:uncharacterized OsmC-like protein
VIGRLVLETVEKGLRFRGAADQGKDLVLDSGPDAIATNPVQAVLLSLGACTGMDVIEILRKKRQVVTSYEITLDADRRSSIASPDAPSSPRRSRRQSASARPSTARSPAC